MEQAVKCAFVKIEKTHLKFSIFKMNFISCLISGYRK